MNDNTTKIFDNDNSIYLRTKISLMFTLFLYKNIILIKQTHQFVVV